MPWSFQWKFQWKFARIFLSQQNFTKFYITGYCRRKRRCHILEGVVTVTCWWCWPTFKLEYRVMRMFVIRRVIVTRHCRDTHVSHLTVCTWLQRHRYNWKNVQSHSAFDNPVTLTFDLWPLTWGSTHAECLLCAVCLLDFCVDSSSHIRILPANTSSLLFSWKWERNTVGRNTAHSAVNTVRLGKKIITSPR